MAIKIDKYGEVTINGPDNVLFIEWIKDHPEHNQMPWRKALSIYIEETQNK